MKTLRYLIPLFGLYLLLGEPALAQGPDASCLGCHRAVAQGGISHRVHGLGADPQSGQAGVGCTDCHGASQAHLTNPGQPPDIRFARGQSDGEEKCLTCHTGEAISHWAFSEHSAAQVGCASCHAIHSAIDPVQERQSQFEVCTDCHQREKMAVMKFSHHPMADGQVQCTDCHAPHGGNSLSGLTGPTLNDTCYQCHAEKRGPFLFEHEPVQDDCSHCHLPHASVNDSLLKAREPFLCQQCHIASRHPGRLYDSNQLGGRDINIVGQSCTNCHSQVHGGNQPASSTFRR
ncbi:MAG: cystathionine beta-synthase [Porticoccaceae bacterium]|nr:cystathionine beta-synthase [Porticoccaceae bacterium]